MALVEGVRPGAVAAIVKAFADWLEDERCKWRLNRPTLSCERRQSGQNPTVTGRYWRAALRDRSGYMDASITKGTLVNSLIRDPAFGRVTL